MQSDVERRSGECPVRISTDSRMNVPLGGTYLGGSK